MLHIQEVIEALIEEAEKHSGNKKHALTVFLKAINVCKTYHLDAEFSSITGNNVFFKSILYGIERGLSRYFAINNYIKFILWHIPCFRR